MPEARGKIRAFTRRMRLRPEKNPVKITYRCPKCYGAR